MRKRLEQKQKVLATKEIGEVLYDLLNLHAQMSAAEYPPSGQYVKNLVNLLKQQYKKQLNETPKQPHSRQIDLEDSIAEIKKEKEDGLKAAVDQIKRQRVNGNSRHHRFG